MFCFRLLHFFSFAIQPEKLLPSWFPVRKGKIKEIISCVPRMILDPQPSAGCSNITCQHLKDGRLSSSVHTKQAKALSCEKEK